MEAFTTKSDIEEWIRIMEEAGVKRDPSLFGKTGYRGHGWYHLGNGVWGGKGAWNEYKKNLHKPGKNKIG